MAQDDNLHLESHMGIQMGTCSKEAMGVRVPPGELKLKQLCPCLHKNPPPTRSTLFHGKSLFMLNCSKTPLVDGTCVDMI